MILQGNLPSFLVKVKPKANHSCIDPLAINPCQIHIGSLSCSSSPVCLGDYIYLGCNVM